MKPSMSCLITGNAIWYERAALSLEMAIIYEVVIMWIIYTWMKYKPIKQNFLWKFNLNTAMFSDSRPNLKFLRMFFYCSNFKRAKSNAFSIVYLSCLQSLRQRGHFLYKNNKDRFPWYAVASHFIATAITVGGEQYQCIVQTEGNKNVIHAVFTAAKIHSFFYVHEHRLMYKFCQKWNA